MSYNPADGFPRVVPALRYRDPAAAVAWLTRVFGFRELLRWVDAWGHVGHADLELQGGVVMVEPAGSPPPPARAGHGSMVIVYVDDVDRHCQHARTHGASVVLEPEDRPWGLRRYRAVDIEGHLWEFDQHLRDVPPEQWGAVAGNGFGADAAVPAVGG